MTTEPVRPADTRRTPGDIPTDHTGLRVLDLDQCLELLASTPVGRLAFELDGEITVLPVAHVVDGVDVCFRTAGDSKIQAAVDRERVAYEADSFDPRDRSGWSVLVQGIATIVDEEAEAHRLEQHATEVWVPVQPESMTWVRVRAQSVSGRSLG
jgi:nitroimidazol reductase NimA-like FMN-containing flavoprotein (pyridoxamine 5'-phosphate oxidase superfamily)